MFKDLAQLGGLLGKAKQMSDAISEARERISQARFTGRSADGAVEIDVLGDQHVLACRIVSSGESDAVLAQDVVEATNDALRQLQAFATEEMRKVSGGLDLGPLQGLLGGR
ncbi:MAG: YbaB/EbfC family nucleoid-associated protein [Planctomycetaceae bacterium]|nr:YbaB/EbfC family nucleoid-associated protein [Planctomycetaceae bacterium]